MFEFKLDNYTVFTELDEDKSLCAFNGEKFIKDVMTIHEKLFPNATLTTQVAKYEEEYGELKNAKTLSETVKEFADLFIVACGISRFSNVVGRDLCNAILKSITDDNDKMILVEAVCRKMNKNQERDWNEIENGYYKHDVSTLN